MPVFSALDRVAATPSLDSVIAWAERPLAGLPRAVRDGLHGVWLGHPLHPALAQAPIGLWTSAAVLDLLAATRPPGDSRDQAEDAAGVLIALGLAAAPLAAASGATDWSRLDRPRQRVGLVHAALNTAGIALSVASLVSRRRGRSGLARALSLAGAGASGLAAGVGGHLSYRHAAGANHAPDVPAELPAGAGDLPAGTAPSSPASSGDPSGEDPRGELDGGVPWTAVSGVTELQELRPARGLLGDLPVAVVVREGRVHVLADSCSHLGGPLSEGHLEDGCLVCPWHGSAFRLEDGSVRHGPATAAQPALEARMRNGIVEARLLTLTPR